MWEVTYLAGISLFIAARMPRRLPPVKAVPLVQAVPRVLPQAVQAVLRVLPLAQAMRRVKAMRRVQAVPRVLLLVQAVRRAKAIDRLLLELRL